MGIAAIVLNVLAVIKYQKMSGTFDSKYLIENAIHPILLLCFLLIVSDDKKRAWCQNNTCTFILYLWFILWSIFGIVTCLQWI